MTHEIDRNWLCLIKNYAYFKYLLKYLSYNKYETDIIINILCVSHFALFKIEMCFFKSDI